MIKSKTDYFIDLAELKDYRYNAVLEVMPWVVSARKSLVKECNFDDNEKKMYSRLLEVEKKLQKALIPLKPNSLESSNLNDNKLFNEKLELINKIDFDTARYWIFTLGDQSKRYNRNFKIHFGDIKNKDYYPTLIGTTRSQYVEETIACLSHEKINEWVGLFKKYFSVMPSYNINMLKTDSKSIITLCKSM